MKNNYYKFTEPTAQFDFVVDITPKEHSIWERYVNTVYKGENKKSLPISSDVKNFIYKYEDEFVVSLYNFVREYNDTFKNLKMKKSHRSDYGSSVMDVAFKIENGVGKVLYFPWEQETKHEKKMFGEFIIEKKDVLKFFNEWSKKKKFDNTKKKIVGSPISKAWTKKDYITYIEILQKRIEELEKKPSK